jgi:gamma-glutamyltranspeptidase/glutathione hydrolase
MVEPAGMVRGMRRVCLAVVVVLLGAAWCAGPAVAKRAVAVGRGGAVVSDSAIATEAGLGVLRRGGTAADAAVAVASTLGVTEPFVAGIGGGGYFVYYDARTRHVYTIDGRETAPAADNAGLFIDPGTGQSLPFATEVTSGLSVGVPGTLMTWRRALARWGRFTLAADLKPAERVARSGFGIDGILRQEIEWNAARFAQFSSTRALFLPGGRLPSIGFRLRNPDLARTYQQIAREGIGAFYGGSIGADTVRAVHHLPLAPGATLLPRPGSMALSDLTDYTTPVRAPTHVRYRGYDVYSMAPSSSGGSTVGEALDILSNFRLGRESRVQVLQHFLEASRLAFADRDRYVGDPRYVNVPLRGLLSRGFARQRACLINPDHAGISPVAPGDPFKGPHGCVPEQPTAAAQPSEGDNTNHFVVADRMGDVVSYTNTIEALGGSGIVVPGRGFLLNNELTDFDSTPIDPGVPDPNLPAGGKRPRSSMSPTIVLHHGRPFLALGAAGGPTIITTVLQILINRIDLHMSLPAAIAAPRASQQNTPTTQAEPAFIALPTTPALESLGQSFAVKTASLLYPDFTIPPTISVATGLELLSRGRMLAAGEPVRRGGSAAGVLLPSAHHAVPAQQRRPANR